MFTLKFSSNMKFSLKFKVVLSYNEYKMASDIEIMTVSPNRPNIDFEKFRKTVRNYIDRHHYLAAEFWANKLVSLSGGAPVDVYYLAQCYYLTKQYHRAILLISTHNLLRNSRCRYLAARCHYETKNYHMVLDVLDQVSKNSCSRKSDQSVIVIPEIEDSTSIECSMHLLKGYIYEAADNRQLAMESFKLAFQIDPLCYEAFHVLTQHHMLSPQEGKDILSSLTMTDTSSDVEESLVRYVYESRLNKYSGVKHKLSPSLVHLETNLDFVTTEAEALHYNCDFNRCFKLTQRVLQRDPYHPECLPIHIACLVELKQANSLFLLGHKLVDYYPENALSWFAVGCYYYLIGKNDKARLFLIKATTLDRVLGPAWIAYGHSFAAENEHDQARAAYYKAAELMKGCHLPLLYIGMEYSLTNNNRYAEEFFKQALEIAPEDPFVHHELGVVAYSSQDYFRKAVKVVEQNEVSALRVCPGVASTYASLGLVQSYLGDYQEAIVSLHKALSLQKDHTVAVSLLSTLMNQVVSNSSVFEDGVESNIPFDLLPKEPLGPSSAPTVPKGVNPPASSSSMDDIKTILGSSIVYRDSALRFL
ncbi:Cell division cycle protein 16-like protein [Armadillidium nasatum]|uniref:Cell division cycle protein 16-like protein n=1 Tax=Armadillidium nasatum TaxID=96803 RepID=A0A5N5T088_9CRUS|nr:Cell division cycle protein 16-like protein [Armadillidium nasatum]